MKREMTVKRVALLSSVPLAFVALAGCSAGASVSTTPATSTSSPMVSIAPSSSAAPVSAAPVSSTAGSGSSSSRDWAKLVAACPNDGQKSVIQKVVTADVTGDGTPDTLVARTCEASTSYWPSTVEVFDGTKRIGTLLSDVAPADMPWFTAMSASGSTVTVKAWGVDDSLTQACPSIAFTYRYTYQDGKFARTGRDVNKTTTCPSVG